MNIFIAVLYEGYRAAHKDAIPSFLQERARICLQCMLLPRFKRRWVPAWVASRQRICCVVLGCVTLPSWVGLLCEPVIHPLVPSTLLFIAVIFRDVLLVKRPGREIQYLWWCTRAEPRVRFEPHTAQIAIRSSSKVAAMPGRKNDSVCAE